MSNRTTSLAKFLIAIYSAQLAPTAPAPTTVTFISKLYYMLFNKFHFQVRINTLGIKTTPLCCGCKSINYSVKKLDKTALTKNLTKIHYVRQQSGDPLRIFYA